MKNMGRIAKTIQRAASIACLISLLCGVIYEETPVPVAYSLESVLICGKQEHTHTGECRAKQLSCTDEVHEHTDSCYQETLICNCEEHTHDQNCYETVEEEVFPVMPAEEETAESEEPSEIQDNVEPADAESTESAAPEDSPVPTEIPETSESPEPTEAAEETHLVLQNLTVQQGTVAVGETVEWSFDCANAQSVTYVIFNESGEQVDAGEANETGKVEWSASSAGIFTIHVFAVRDEEQAELTGSVLVEAITEPLEVSVTSQQKYAFAQKDALVFETSYTGGTEPIQVEYIISANGNTVFSLSGYEAQISYLPQEFGIHTLTMTATDANGQQVSASWAVPVAIEDRESKWEWEKTFADVEITGNYAVDILSIAETQLGYRESERDFIIDEDGTQHGYTRYGAWYGASYSEWCAMFVSFCAHYAEIPEEMLPQEANCAKWKQKLGKKYLDDESSYLPEAGDLIFFHHNRTGETESAEEKNVPNHVGIVANADESSVYTIEGNNANRVRECEYDLNDEHIVGYVSMATIMPEDDAQSSDESVEADTSLAFERLPYEDEVPEDMEMLESGLLYYADGDDEIYMVYGRYGEGEAQLYLCDAEGIPFGEYAGLWEIMPAATRYLAVNVKPDKIGYTNADGENIVILTIEVTTDDDGELKKDKVLTLSLAGAGDNLTVDSISATNGAFANLAVSGNTITATATSDVKKQNTVTVVCHYTIPIDTETSTLNVSVSASETGKSAAGNGSASYSYIRYTGVRISTVDVPNLAYAWGETVNAKVQLKNFDANVNTVTKLVVKDEDGNAVCTLENLAVTLDGNGIVELPFSFAAPDAGYDIAEYTVEAIYGDDESTTNVEHFSIVLPTSPKLDTEKDVSVAYDENDNAFFETLKVTVTNNLAGTGNSNNAGNIQMRNADGNWVQIAYISGKNISDGDFGFDLNGKLTPDQVLNNPFRVELTRANGSALNTKPQSEWFYLTDSLPKTGFREWVLDPANGYLNADGTFNGDMNALAEAYKKYSRLRLIVNADAVTGKAGETVELPICVQSDEAMEIGGVIELTLKDNIADGAIAPEDCEAISEYGTVVVQNGKLLLTLDRRIEAGESAVISVKTPLNYGVEMGAHAIALDAKYRDSTEVKKQGQGEGTINVTAGEGWHILRVESPSEAAIIDDEATYTLKIRNFDAQSVTITNIQALLEENALELIGIRAGESDISTDSLSVVIPAATGENTTYCPGDILLQLRVKTPDTVMDVTTVSFTLTDTNGHSETAEGTLSVRRPYAPMPVETVESNQTGVTVRKTWVDNNNADGKRPEMIYVQLQMNGEATGEPVKLTAEQANEDGEWVYTWSELPYKDAQGEVIGYSVVENVSGEGMQWYEVQYGDVETIEDPTRGTTHWTQANKSNVDENAKYAIYANGAVLDSSSNAVAASILGSCTYDDVTYNSELASSPESTSQWELIPVTGGYRIKCGSTYLIAEDKKMKFVSNYEEKDNYRSVFVFDDATGGLKVLTKDGKTWCYLALSIKDNKAQASLETKSENAAPITLYRETTVVGKNDSYVRQLTNVYKDPNARTSLIVKKDWANNGAFLHENDSVEMTLYQNGEPMLVDGQEVRLTLNAENQWSGEFTDLLLYNLIDANAGLMEKYAYTVRETKVEGYTATGEDDVTFIPNDDSPGEGHYEVTVTNTRDQVDYSAKKPDTSVHKRIDYLGDGIENPDTTIGSDDDYRLYLDFTGASEPIDILFVIDTTGSMTYAMGSTDTTPRQTVVSNLMNDTDGKMGFLNQAITLNPQNNVAVMLFSGPVWDTAVNGRPYQDNKADCQYIMLDWTSDGQLQGTHDYSNRKSGTYYDPAIMRAREMFADPQVVNNGHRKVMIFITDGEPNGYIDENLTYQTSSFDVASEHILQRMADFKAEFPSIDVFTVGISQDTTSSKGLLTAMTAGSGTFFQADDTAGLTKGLGDIMDSLKPRNVVITDELSENVTLNIAQPDLKVTRTNTATGEVDVIWTGSNVGVDGCIGSAAEEYENIIQSVQYTASGNADSGGTVQVTFNPDLLVDSQYTYTLSYNVKLTGAAYQYTDNYDEYEFVGDADTDYGTNSTSSEKPGLLANNHAKASYTASGKGWQDDYPYPVVQTAQKNTTIEAPEVFKRVQADGAPPEDSMVFLFNIEAVEPKNAPMPVQQTRSVMTASWVYDAEQETPEMSGTATSFGTVTFDEPGTYQYRITEMTGEDENWSYDETAYLWTVTVTRQPDNNLMAEGVLTKDGEAVDKAEFVNEYVGHLPLTIVKSDSTDHDKRLSGATFSIYSDAACAADSLVTVYADAGNTQELTEITTAGENGEITVYGLKPGTYYLKESAAPDGYCLIEGTLTIFVGKDGVATSGESQRIAVVEGKIVVYDSPIYDIPSTGGQGTRMFGVTGLALMLMAAVLLIYRRRERGSGAR